MTTHNPDFRWYSTQSREMKLSPRCPFASAGRCPRYYASLSLLGKDGIITEISEEDQTHLAKKWESFTPVVAEEDVAITRIADTFRSVSGLCPEVGFEIFGYFVSYLATYADEIDRDVAHKRLNAQEIHGSDSRWRWSIVQPRHYTECREYSMLR
jgi:hypothetical protein